MDYFTDRELQGFKSKIDPNLLTKLNELRKEWDAKIFVSSAKGAVGRYDNSESMHNVNKWKMVKAIDLFPQSKKNKGGIIDNIEAMDFIKLARKHGFKGIGVYPNFHPSWGFHIDIRNKSTEWIDVALYPKHEYKYGRLEDLLKEIT